MPKVKIITRVRIKTTYHRHKWIMAGFALGSEALRSVIIKENHSLENVKMENKCFFLLRLFNASTEHSSSQLRFKVTWLIGVRIRPPVVALNALHTSSSSASSEINHRGVDVKVLVCILFGDVVFLFVICCCFFSCRDKRLVRV